jgi:uncharacterized membrane protein YcaP (DUF421 family)
LLLTLHWIMALWVSVSPRASRLFEGRPIPILKDGQISKSARIRNGISEADLAEALRSSGLEDHHGARKVTLEPSGNITVLKG